MQLGISLSVASAAVFGGSSWTPPGFGSSLKLWLPRGGPYDLEAGDVLRHHDASGEGNDATQSTPENRPVPEPDGFGAGISAIRYQGESSHYLSANAIAQLLSGDSVSFVVAEQVENVSGVGAGWCAANSGNTIIHTAQYPHVGGTGKLRHFRRNDAGGTTDRSSTSDFPSGPQVIITEHDGDARTTTIYIIDPDSPFTTLTTIVGGVATFDTFTISAQNSNGSISQPLDCRRGAFLVWPGIASLEDIATGARAAVMNQLKADIGL